MARVLFHVNPYSPDGGDELLPLSAFQWGAPTSPAGLPDFGIRVAQAGKSMNLSFPRTLTPAQSAHLSGVLGQIASGQELDERNVHPGLRLLVRRLGDSRTVLEQDRGGPEPEYERGFVEFLADLADVEAGDAAGAGAGAGADPEPMTTAEYIRHLFGKLMFREPDWSPPPWLLLRGKSRWLGPDALPKRVKTLYERDAGAFDGCCAYLALAASGIGARELNGGRKGADQWAYWRNCTGEKLLDFLESVRQEWRVYDATGRLVAAGGEKVANKPVVHLIAGLGHISAARGSGATPIELAPISDDASLAPVFRELDAELAGPEGLKVRSASSLEANAFYERCKIRAPEYHCARESKFGLDLNSAYPTILENVTTVIPVPSLLDTVEEFGSMRSMTVEPASFMRVALETETERRIFGGGRAEAWIWGDAIRYARGGDATVMCSGVYRISRWISGRPLGHEGAAKRAIERWGRKEMARADPEKVRRAAICNYTGYLEKIESHPVAALLESGRLQPEELDYFRVAYEDPDPITGEEFVAHTAPGILALTKRRHFRTTGRIAKLAIYSYTAAKLVMYAKIVGQDPVYVKTDAIHFEERPDDETIARVMHPGEMKEETPARTTYTSASPVFPIGDLDVGRRGLTETTRDEILADIADGRPPKVWLSGPAGTGKTRFALGDLKEACEAKGWAVEVLTPTRHLADATGMRTLEDFGGRNLCADHAYHRAQRSVIIVDEVGLIQGHELAYIASLRPKGLVIIGDQHQLANIDIGRNARHLGLKEMKFDLHANDRYGGNAQMHAVIRSIMPYIDPDINAFGCGDDVKQAVDIQLRLNGVAVQSRDDFTKEADDLVLGWRHRYVDPRGGATVHSAQGRTLEDGKTLHIVDWRDAGPRLLYTALTRARSIENIRLYV
jgi:hypothetical protein